MEGALEDIAWEHFRVDSLDPDADWSGLHGLGADNLRRALEAAYLAGRAARDRASEAEAEAGDSAESGAGASGEAGAEVG